MAETGWKLLDGGNFLPSMQVLCGGKDREATHELHVRRVLFDLLMNIFLVVFKQY
jgi:hypothetical protein